MGCYKGNHDLFIFLFRDLLLLPLAPIFFVFCTGKSSFLTLGFIATIDVFCFFVTASYFPEIGAESDVFDRLPLFF